MLVKNKSNNRHRLYLFIKVFILLASVVLHACSNSDDSEPPNTPPIDQNPTNPDQDVFISGQVTFDYIPHRTSNSSLNYLGVEPRASRGVTVQLLDDSGQLLRDTVTDEQGRYELGSPADTPVQVRVIAELDRDGLASWNIRVADNTQNNAVYAMVGSLSNSGSSNSVRNLNAPSGWVDDEYNEPRVAGPFAILDAIYDALSLLETADPFIQLQAAQIRWSVENRPVDGDTEDGDIGTSYFDPSDGNIYLLGLADNDTDEYDRTVIQHEFAHLIEHQLSRTESIGGNHRIDENLDIRVAFSEGWGNAFSGMASNTEFYRDSGGANQDLGFAIALELVETPGRGWFSEGSVHNLLFDIYDDTSEAGDDISAGFIPIYQALVSNTFTQSEAMIGLHVFNEALLPFLSLDQQNAYLSLLADHQIFGVDEFATAETNDGSNLDALPLYLDPGLNSNIQVCTNNVNGEWNKLANRRFILIDLPDTTQRSVTLTVTGRSADAFVDLHRRGRYIQTLDLSTSSTVSVNFPPTSSGVHILEYYEDPNIDDDDLSGGNYCATLRIN